jgi:hypothetical protein
VVKVLLCVEYCVLRMYGGRKVGLHVFVNSADGGELLASCYGCFVCVESCLDHTGLVAGRVLAIVANINVSFPCREQSWYQKP